METKAFSVPALVSLTTGRLLCPFGDMHEAAEHVMGHSIWSHEFGSEAMFKLLRLKVLEQHPDLDVDASGVDEHTWEAFRDKLTAELGETREIRKGDEDRTVDPVTSLRSMIGPDKPITVLRDPRE